MGEPQIIIDGRAYALPRLDAITMGQARVLKRYTGLSLAEIADVDGTDPDLIAAFCHLAIQAEEPHKSYAAIEREVEAISFTTLEFAGGDEESPPIPGPSEQPSTPSDSGNGSDQHSMGESPAKILPPIGVAE